MEWYVHWWDLTWAQQQTVHEVIYGRIGKEEYYDRSIVEATRHSAIIFKISYLLLPITTYIIGMTDHFY